VIVYTAVRSEEVELIRVPVMLATGVVCDVPLVNPLPVGEVHVYKVPAGTLPLVTSEGITANEAPEQMVVLMPEITAEG
jgi:hypothetical protein